MKAEYYIARRLVQGLTFYKQHSLLLVVAEEYVKMKVVKKQLLNKLKERRQHSS
jgi:hypothetical protein